MDHQTIDETHVVERYLLGQLSPQEAETFEDHYLDCPECLERLELSKRLRQGLLQVATEEAVRTAAVHRLGLLAALARLGRSRQLGLVLAAAVVVLLLPAGLRRREVRRLDGELAETRARAAHEPPANPANPAELEAARQALAAEQARAARERTELQQKSEQLSAELAKARQPQVNTPIYSLSPERSGPGEGEPSNRIASGPPAGWIVLSLDLGSPSSGSPNQSFRATLRRGATVVWQGGGLQPDPQGSLVLSLPASLLAPGDYSMTVEASHAATHFTFRVRPDRRAPPPQ
jgi:hypothetical protein